MSDPTERDHARDRELGMNRAITRRDFLDGVAVTVGSLALAGTASGLLAACESRKPTLETPRLVSYPPELTGLRGQTDAARAVPHMLRDGKFWGAAGSPRTTGENYDLVVVGGGISGLAAAYLYSRQNPKARILVLDNHDDFGGHARRNEFTPVVNRYGRLLIGFGGTESIDSPDTFKPEVLSVLKDIGIELERFYTYFDRTFYERLGLVNRLKFYDKETWGRDHIVVFNSDTPIAEQLKDAPLADAAKRDLVMIIEHPEDWLPGLSDTQKKERLAKITYAQYLSDTVHVHPDVVKCLYTASSDEWGYGIDGVGAIDAWADGVYPGFDGLGLSWAKPSEYNAPTEKQFWNSRVPYIFHFPEGGAGVARLLVRRLIPSALSGRTMADEVLARLEYEQLDRPENRVRIRLGSPVVRVKNVGDPAIATEVEVTYVQSGEMKTVTAKGAIVACWYSMVPYIVDGLPAEQKKAALFMTRIPLLYATVQLRNWRAFQKLKIQTVRTVGPGAFWLNAFLDYPVSMGGYEHPSDPDGPILVHMTSTPCKPGIPPREGVRVGRQELYGTPFSDIERSIRDLFARSLGSAGFDPANDIQAITVNRWAHGYTFEYGLPWDINFYPDGPLPGDVASRPFGRITFANTDRSSRAYIDSAIDAAYGAVNDLLGRA